MLGLVRPSKPVSFGLLSRGGSLSLVLPGWGILPNTATKNKVPDESTVVADGHLSVLNALSGQSPKRELHNNITRMSGVSSKRHNNQ